MATGLRALFVRRDFRRLFIGQTVSGLGDWIATFAFIAVVFSLTGNTSSVAIVLILRLVPPLFAAPVGGTLADRLPRRTIMIVSDLTRAGLIALVPFVDIWLVYTIALVHEFISLFFLPARDASVPELAGQASLEQANGLMMAASYGSLPIAAAIFALLPHSLPALRAPSIIGGHGHPDSLAFFFDALTFLVSAWFISRITISYKAAGHKHTTSVKSDILEGITFLWKERDLRELAYGMIMAMFGGGVLFAVGIAYVRQTLAGSDATFGWLAALWGVGMGMGLLLIRFLVSHRSRLAVFITTIFFCGGLLVVMALLPFVWLALSLAVPFGAAFSLAIMLAMTLAQSSVDELHRGRMMGGVQMLYRLGLGSGAITMGALAHSLKTINLGEHLDGNQFGMFVGGLLIMGAACLTLPLSRDSRFNRS